MRSVVGALCAVMIIVSVPHSTFGQAPLRGFPGSEVLFPGGCHDMPAPASFTPSIVAGYVRDKRKTDYSFTARGAGIGGVTRRRYEYELSALYLAGVLPVTMRDLGAIVLSGSWAAPSRSGTRADDFNPPGVRVGGRTWTGDTSWATGEVLAAYGLCPGVSGLAGCRWDYWQTSYDDPTKVSAGFAAAASSDTAFFHLESWSPFLGLACGLYGVRLAGLAGTAAGGFVEHKEARNGGGSQRFDVFSGALDKTYFFELTGEITVASGSIQGGTNGRLSLFVKYNTLSTQADVRGRRTGTATAEDTFDFEVRRDLVVVGAEATVTF